MKYECEYGLTIWTRNTNLSEKQVLTLVSVLSWTSKYRQAG